MNMISVEEALAYVLTHFRPLEPERVQLLDSLDRVLTEDIVSDMNVPHFNNSAMDGFAVMAEDILNASGANPVTLRVVGTVAAGETASDPVGRGTAVRIMTGAPTPPGADTVVPFEETSAGCDRDGTWRRSVEIMKGVRRGDNVRMAGEDIRAGEVVFQKGTIVRPGEIGVMASLGKDCVSVHRRPRIAILATGDELVEICGPVTPGKIRNSNGYSNAASVLKAGGVPVQLGIARDNIGDLTAKLREGLDADVDLFITSAGVSVGDYDIVKDFLKAEGEVRFWQVRMKPGKPLAFGILRGRKQVPLLALPGNPVSAMISFDVFARPAILKMLGRTEFARPTVHAVLQGDVRNNSHRRNIIRVIVGKGEGGFVCRPTGAQGSGILTSIARANGFMVVPEDVTLVRSGETVEVQMLHGDL